MKPVLQSLVLADRVYEDRGTGKKVISGTFNTLLYKRNVPQPAGDGPGKQRVIKGGMQAGSPWLYLSLTDLSGEITLNLRYLDLQEDKVLFEGSFPARSEDKLSTVEVVAPLPPLPTPHAGVYALELLCDQELLGSLRITVKELTS